MFNRLIPEIPDISYRQLIEYGVHVGHSRSTSSIFCAWMVVAFRQGLYVINLYKFLHMLRIGFVVLTHAVRTSGPIWFINLDGSSDRYVKFPAMECGEMWVCNFWISGMISNYATISNSYRQVRSRSTILKHRRHFVRDTNYNNWAYTRFTWPRVIFVSNVFKSYQPCKESLSLKIPCLGIVDTNAKSNVVSIAIPGNDESIDCLVFYNTLISNFILFRKYSKVYKWFAAVRNKNRLITFKQWFANKFSTNLALNYNLKLNLQGNFRFNYISTIIRGSTLFFCQSYWLHEIREKLFIFPFYKDIAKFEKHLKINRSNLLAFFKKYQNINIILANFCFMSVFTNKVFKFKTSKWLKGNAWIHRHSQMNGKDNGPLYSAKSLLRSLNIMRLFSKESLYIDYNSKVKYLSKLSRYWRNMAYKFVTILLLFSSLKYLIFYSKRFYRSWPSWWRHYHSFQYPYYALKEPSNFLNCSLSLFRHEKRDWNKIIYYSKYNNNLFQSIDPFKISQRTFIQLPGKWFLDGSNPNFIPFLSGFLGLSSMFPFFYSSKIETKINVNYEFLNFNSIKNEMENNLLKFKKLDLLNRIIAKKYSKRNLVLSSLIGNRKLPFSSLFSVSSWVIYNTIQDYRWNNNFVICNIYKPISLSYNYAINQINLLFIPLKLTSLIKEVNFNKRINRLVKRFFMRCFFFNLDNGAFLFRFVLCYSLLFSYLKLNNSEFIKNTSNNQQYPNFTRYSRKWSLFDKKSLIFSWNSVLRKNSNLKWSF